MQHTLEVLGLQPLGDSFRPPSSSYLATLESELEAALPPEYRAFLAEYGVCTFADYVTFSLPGGARVDMNMFLGSDPDDSYDVREVWRGLADRLPPQFLPFALDPFGNALCINVSQPNYGSVHFWDHETDQVLPVASSFPAFIAILKRETE